MTELYGVVGSQAYGLATPESDIDRLGVFVAPLYEVLSLSGVNHETRVGKDMIGDWTDHEVGKFLRLCTQANPTVMELLWLDEYLIETSIGTKLIGLRKAVLSQRAIQSYMGYVSQQASRLVSRGGTFDPDLKKRTQKHGRHCWRLLIQGAYLSQSGAVQVRLTEQQADDCRNMGEYAELEPLKFAAGVEERIKSIKDKPTVLPDKPDLERVNKVLREIRLA
jgi:uncharacterized protein